MRRLARYINIIGNNLVLLAIALYFLAPLTWLITAAFRSNPSVSVEFTNWTLSNFPRILNPDTARWIRNSLFIGVVTTLISSTLSFLAAYPFARFDFPGKTALLFALVISMTIPLSSVMLPTFSLARWLGLANTLIGVALIAASRQIPTALWVIKEFIATIPVELEEAAWVDGAGRLDTLFRIVFPLSAPGLAVIGMMAFVSGWGDFTISLILLNSEELLYFHVSLWRGNSEDCFLYERNRGELLRSSR